MKPCRTKEIWKPAKGFEGRYAVSNLGRVKSLERKVACLQPGMFRTIKERVLKPGRSGPYRNYLYVNLWKGNKQHAVKIHRLVALAFIPNPYSKPEVNHKDGDKNNNRFDNLEWATYSENMDHGYKTKLIKVGAGHTWSTISDADVIAIRRKYKKGVRKYILARMFKVHATTIDRIVDFKIRKRTEEGVLFDEALQKKNA